MRTSVHVVYLRAFLVFLVALSTQSLHAQASLALNGAGQYVQVPANPSFTPAHLTFEAWVYPTNASCNTILSRGDGGNNSLTDYILDVGYDGHNCGTMTVGFFAAGAWDASINTVPLNTWTHVAVTYDGTNKVIYIDGIQDSSWPRPGPLHSTPGSPLFIGMQGTACACNFFNGLLGEVRFWNTVRTASQIQSDMNYSSGPQPGLVAYYHLNEGSDIYAYDDTGNGNIGTLEGGASWSSLAPPSEVVTDGTDGPGPGTLRAAIANATSGDVIAFAPNLSGAAIPLVTTLTINTSLTIDASALPGGIQINGGHFFRVFSVASSVNAVLNSLTITNGGTSISGGYGGGIENFGVLTLNQCTVSGNSSLISGGGIANYGTLSLNQCTLSGNNAETNGGIDNEATLTLNQCTLSGNSATNGGGGGIYNKGTLTVTNSIVAGNNVSVYVDIDIANVGTLTYGGSNLVQSVVNQGGTISGPAPLNAAPNLAPLGNYGGPTQTMLPMPGSPVMGAGSVAANTLSTDQRGYPRTRNGRIDIGAVELPSVSVTDPADVGLGTLRSAIASAVNGEVIIFATNLSGAIITLTHGVALPINTNLTIDASALPSGIQINGDMKSTVFNVSTGVTAVLNSLTITNALSGAIFNGGTLTLNQCALLGNSASDGAGIANSGTLSLNQCTLSGNNASDSGDGVYNAVTGTVSLNQCTVSGNYGNIAIENHGTLTVTNTIAAGNDLVDISSDGTLTYGGPNLLEIVDGTASGSAPLNADPNLALLGNYGGPTQTMPPAPGSPAIGAGSVAANTFTTDQRGYPRTQNGRIDIGAVELPIVQPFTANPTKGLVPLNVQFASTNVDSDGSAIVGRTWSFGNGNASSLQNPTNIYGTAGSFSPGLTVINSLGLALSVSGPAISVYQPLGFAGVTLSGTNLTLRGSNGVSGLAYTVLTSTNLNLPLNQWTPLGTNTWSSNGAFSLILTNVLNPPVRARFYRLGTP